MGLTIYYGIKAKLDADGARRVLKEMHRRIAKLPWDEVSGVMEIDPPDGKHVFTRREPGHYKPGWEYLERKRADGEREMVHVPSLHVMYFSARVKGAESATFGLATHPPVVLHREDVKERDEEGREVTRCAAGQAVEVPTRMRGWYSWRNFCKTQYAGNPKLGGEKNFLRAHLSVYHALDICRELGMKTRVRDDGRYHKHKNVEKLLEWLRYHDELVAGVVGALGDALGKTEGAIVAPIRERGDFEHLEARGVARMKGKRPKRG